MSSKLDMFIQSASTVIQHPYYRFSLPSLNLAIGSKEGIRGGKIVQFAGKPKTGKSTLSLDLIKNAQQDGKLCAYVDFERSFDRDYSAQLGVNNDDLLLVKTDTGEQSFDIVLDLIKNRGVSLVVIDSIVTALPSSEYEKQFSDPEKMAAMASFVSRFCKRMLPVLDNHGAVVVAINQVRANISTMSRKETKLAGPWALHFYSNLIIEAERVKNEDGRATVRAAITKNRSGPEGGLTEYWLTYGKGLDIAADILQLALKYGIVERKGAWYMYNDQKAQGMDSAALSFPLEEIERQIYETVKAGS